MTRVDEVRSRHREAAIQLGINPRDVDLLLSDVLERSVGWLFAHGEEEIDDSLLLPLLARRFSGEPLQYIRRRTEFYGREFYVDDRVLIPRPETEIAVETVLEHAPQGGRVVDVGVGSGCIAISIERERPDLHLVAVDRSPAALAVARLNRDRLQSRVHLAASDLLTALRGSFDIVVSNPPYVPLGEYEELAVEVRIHEPMMAVTPGPGGTEIIERLLDQAAGLLAPQGLAVIEVGFGQEAVVRGLAAQRDWRVDAFLPDLAGIPRIVVLSRDGD